MRTGELSVDPVPPAADASQVAIRAATVSTTSQLRSLSVQASNVLAVENASGLSQSSRALPPAAGMTNVFTYGNAPGSAPAVQAAYGQFLSTPDGGLVRELNPSSVPFGGQLMPNRPLAAEVRSGTQSQPAVSTYSVPPSPPVNNPGAPGYEVPSLNPPVTSVYSAPPPLHPTGAGAAIADGNVAANANVALRARSCSYKMTAGLVVGSSITSLLVGGGFTALGLWKAGVLNAAENGPLNPMVPVPDKSVAPPQKPKKLYAFAQGTDTILVFWPYVPDIKYYLLKRNGTAIMGSSGNSLIGGETNSYTDTGLTAGTTYSYTLIATNTPTGQGDVESPESDPATATTLTSPPPAPDAPTDLVAKATAIDKIRVTWTAVPYATKYTITRSYSPVNDDPLTNTASGNLAPVMIDVTGGNVGLYYDDTGLSPATQYGYAVQASNQAGSSAISGKVFENTWDLVDLVAQNMVNAWNALPEDAYWAAVMAWLDTDRPSGVIQYCTAAFSYQIADKRQTPLLGEPLIASQVSSLLATFNNSLQTDPATGMKTGDFDTLYAIISTLSASGAALARYEKLRILCRVLDQIVAASKT
jgi:hypothetical protein